MTTVQSNGRAAVRGQQSFGGALKRIQPWRFLKSNPSRCQTSLGGGIAVHSAAFKCISSTTVTSAVCTSCAVETPRAGRSTARWRPPRRAPSRSTSCQISTCFSGNSGPASAGSPGAISARTVCATSQLFTCRFIAETVYGDLASATSGVRRHLLGLGDVLVEDEEIELRALHDVDRERDPFVLRLLVLLDETRRWSSSSASRASSAPRRSSPLRRGRRGAGSTAGPASRSPRRPRPLPRSARSVVLAEKAAAERVASRVLRVLPDLGRALRTLDAGAEVDPGRAAELEGRERGIDEVTLVRTPGARTEPRGSPSGRCRAACHFHSRARSLCGLLDVFSSVPRWQPSEAQTAEKTGSSSRAFARVGEIADHEADVRVTRERGRLEDARHDDDWHVLIGLEHDDAGASAGRS